MRREDWPARLHVFLEAARNRPFRWGEIDCCLFAAAGVAAITGVDPAAELRGRYRTEAGAYRRLKRYGGLAQAAEHFARLHGFAEVPPLNAQRGDVVLVDNLGRPMLGLVDLRGEIAATGDVGLIRLPLRVAVRAWRVQ